MGLGEVGERWVGQEEVGERWVGQEEVGKRWLGITEREQLWPWLNLCFSVEALFCAGLAILLIVLHQQAYSWGLHSLLFRQRGVLSRQWVE